ALFHSGSTARGTLRRTRDGQSLIHHGQTTHAGMRRDTRGNLACGSDSQEGLPVFIIRVVAVEPDVIQAVTTMVRYARVTELRTSIGLLVHTVGIDAATPTARRVLTPVHSIAHLFISSQLGTAVPAAGIQPRTVHTSRRLIGHQQSSPSAKRTNIHGRLASSKVVSRWVKCAASPAAGVSACLARVTVFLTGLASSSIGCGAWLGARRSEHAGCMRRMQR